MTSVEQIQKVERLASELLKNRMASSRDDALRRAQDILQIKLGSKVHPVNMTMVTEEEYSSNTTPTPSVNAQGLPSSNNAQNQNTTINGDQKMYGFPEQQKTQGSSQTMTNNPNIATKEDLAKEIEKLRKDMNSGLIKLFEELKKSLDENHSSIKQILLGSQPRARPMQQQSSSQSENVERITIDERKEEVEAQSETTREISKEKSSRPMSNARKPRTGEFKPGDDKISVDNVFYFGNK